MKYNIFNKKMFNEIVETYENIFNIGGGTTLHIFKHYVIGSVIDDCYYRSEVIIINNSVYVLENNDRSGELYDAMYNIEAASINEWTKNVMAIIH